jgi:hypothetical protein
MEKAITEKDIIKCLKLFKKRNLEEIDIVLKIWKMAYLRCLKNIKVNLNERRKDNGIRRL